MAPHKKPPDESYHKLPHDPQHLAADRKVLRAFASSENAKKAVDISRGCVRSLRPGKIWTQQAPHGALEIKGALMLEADIVVVLNFSSEDASVLPKGLHSLTVGSPEILSLAEARLKEMPQQITVLDGAEFREPESCWTIPMAHQGRIVGHLKVSSDGSKILPDRKATEDLKRIKRGM